MRGLGRGMREFNDAKNNVKKEFEEGMNEPPKIRDNLHPPHPQTTLSHLLQ